VVPKGAIDKCVNNEAVQVWGNQPNRKQSKSNNQTIERRKTLKKTPLVFISMLLILSLCSAAFAADTPAAAPKGVVNLNSADTSQLSLLPRVGAKAAQRIVDYRKEHGSFQKTTELMQVKGFGQKRFDQVSAYLTVSGNTTLAAKVKSPRKARTKKPATTAAM
jgi:competence protein ComEA